MNTEPTDDLGVYTHEERYLLYCIQRLQRQFEIDSKPYVDKLTAIRARQTPARFYVTSRREYISDPSYL